MYNFEDIIDKGKTYMVTGGAGFIGSNIVEVLLNNNAKVICIDNFSGGKECNIAPFLGNRNFKFIKMDIKSYDECLSATTDVDYILHQAGLGSVPRSLEEPLIYYESNITGTLNMLQAAKENGVSRFVYASSSSVYGDNEKKLKVVGEEGYVLSPYAMTKATCEHYANLYYRVYGMETIGLRYFNVYGKRQDPDSVYAAVIPKFIKGLFEKKRVSIYGDGEQVRDFTYVTDVVSANLKACLAPPEAAGRVYNIACGNPVSVNQLFEKLRTILGCGAEPLYEDERRGDIKNSCADISLTKKYLNYYPKVLIDEGLSLTVNSYLSKEL